MGMEKTQTLQTNLQNNWFDHEAAKRLIDRAFFGMAQTFGAPEQSGIRVEARLVERDKAFLGNRLRVSA